MAANMLHGASNVVGNVTSGGTESILIAMMGYRQQARTRGIETPEVICAHTAHPAIDKACHYFNMKLVKLLANENHQLDPAEVRAHVNSNT